MSDEIVLGLDLGTGGARCIAATLDGDIIAQAATDLPREASVISEGLHEQQPEAWWTAAKNAISRVAVEIRDSPRSIDAVQGISVDGTSGTVVPVDAQLNALRPALMYNDGRATDQATALNEEQAAFCDKLGYRFASSFALAKIRWLVDNEPQLINDTQWFAHQADFIAWRLSDQGGVTDYSNALKTGYDLVDEQWPGWIDASVGGAGRLPNVVAPGSVIAQMPVHIAEQVGLPAGVKVVAGCTDGTAGVLASGARKIGDDNTTLGTTLVFKRIANECAKDAQGLIYSHKLPGGRWLPGAASNVGGGWIREWFGDADLEAMDAGALRWLWLPTDFLAYPLTKRGERFPFKSDTIEAFLEPDPLQDITRYAANLQGTAFVERLCYEYLNKTTDLEPGDVYATGGGSRSDVWMQLRADISRRTLHRLACSEAAFGAAVLASAGSLNIDVWDTSRQMVKLQKTFEPKAEACDAFDVHYDRFRQKLIDEGYIEL
ncbi:MAG: FGGY-family carbohydrate kinase [Pirellulales bacterium]|nr:FGGY-family carbohydrate kinase [Pirellulales bacterium]